MSSDQSSRDRPSLPKSIRFNYVKSPQFRTIHVDGAIGGITPRGSIHCALYSERQAIPQITELEVTPEGRAGKELNREGRVGFVRDLDVDLQMSIRTAKELRDWLSEKIDELENLLKLESEAQKK